MGKEIIEMSTDEESDRLAVCPPNGEAEGPSNLINGSKNHESPEQVGFPHERATDTEKNGNEESSENLESQKVDEIVLSPSHSTEGAYSSVVTDALATERRASGNNGSRENAAEKSCVESPTKSSPKSTQKSLESSFHLHDDDSGSITSSTGTSARANKFKTTVAVAPTFRSGQRAEKRKEFFSKFNEKQKALEEEKQQAEARKKEEQEEALKELRKNLVIRANPMPAFYQEGPPPKAELKKVPPTRAKSPKFTRRKSCSDSPNSPLVENAACCRLHRHSVGGPRDASSPQCSLKSVSNVKSNGGAKVARSREEAKATVGKALNKTSHGDVAVRS